MSTPLGTSTSRGCPTGPTRCASTTAASSSRPPRARPCTTCSGPAQLPGTFRSPRRAPTGCADEPCARRAGLHPRRGHRQPLHRDDRRACVLHGARRQRRAGQERPGPRRRRAARAPGDGDRRLRAALAGLPARSDPADGRRRHARRHDLLQQPRRRDHAAAEAPPVRAGRRAHRADVAGHLLGRRHDADRQLAGDGDQAADAASADREGGDDAVLQVLGLRRQPARHHQHAARRRAAQRRRRGEGRPGRRELLRAAQQRQGGEQARLGLPAVDLLPHRRPHGPREGTEMPVRARRAGEAGFTMVTVMGTLLIASLLTLAAFAAVNGDARESGKDVGRKQALAAAEAGVNDYLFRLNQDNGFWAKCTNVAAPNAVNDVWDGAGPDPRKWRNVPGSAAQYAIELLPVAPYSKCTAGTNVASSMIDASSRTLRIRVTGRVPTAAGMDYRSVIAAVKRDGFLDFLYFTDYETSDSVWYAVSTDGRPTDGPQGDVISWAANNCNTPYWR